MLIKTHLVFSIFLFLIFYNVSSFESFQYILFFCALIFGTILLDIDSKNSWLGRNWIFRPLQLFLSHRGFVHSLVFILIVDFFIFLLNEFLALGFLVGCFSHIFLDLFTRSGLRLFWPFYNKPVSLIGIKSGGLIEQVIFVLLLLLDIFIVGKIVFEKLFLMI